MNIMNRTSQYRIEALVELARAFPEARPSSFIAHRRAIPQAYLSRLLAELTRSGWVRAQRGPRGGVRLARSPESTPVSAAFDGPIGNDHMPPALARLVRVIGEAVEERTASISIADIARWESELNDTADYSI
jgi:DNA-binding IscR family transcriptional regulator